MRNIFNRWIGMAAAAVCGAVLAAGTVQLAHGQAAKKNWKDQAEYDSYNAVGAALAKNDFTKALASLDAWKQKYPASDFKDEFTVLYIQAYAGAKQPDKAVDAAGELINKGVDTAFPDPASGPGNAIKVLFTTVVAITQIPNPTADQLAVGEKAAHQLVDYNRKPQGVADDAWNTARTTQLQPPAKAAMLYISMLPGNQAFAKKDWPAAEAAYTKALQEYPDNAALSWQLGLTYRSESKRSEAVWSFQRAVVQDATLGGRQDAKTMTNFADQYYSTIHGSNEGLDAVKAAVKASPLPPADFKVKTATEIAEEKQKEFEQSNPQLALWMKIKGALADASGEEYFSGQLKDSAVPKLKGTVVEATKCRAKEILVSIPLPDAQGAQKPEITLKLDAPLTGKVDAGQEFQWEGVPTAFTKDPFMLTMDVEKAKIEGLKTSPCAVPAKKGPASKKKG